MRKFYKSFVDHKGLSLAFAGCVIMALSASCDDDDSDCPYAIITRESFTFSESYSDNNSVTVFSNTSWEVEWSPSSVALVVSPSSGIGSGSFTVVDLPAGTEVQVWVHGVDVPYVKSAALTINRNNVLTSMKYLPSFGVESRLICTR